jgi:hypothetical protein
MALAIGSSHCVEDYIFKEGTVYTRYGYRYYNKFGWLHNNSGPAVRTHDGDQFWYIDGECHREDGPAILYMNGATLWYYHNKSLPCKSNKEFLRLIKLKALW